MASGIIGLDGASALAQPGSIPPPVPQALQPGDPASADVQVLTRGPLHEAFAESVAFNPVPGPIVPKAPPAPVEEQAPDQKPEGGDVEWIPGFWSWDDERNDYIWVSGIWRDIPPGRQWVPGYWMQAENGFQWTSGFWAADANAELTYLPVAPPQSLENGPSSPQPGENFAWTPGCWSWQEDRYVWRPGYWIQTQPEWIWIPSRYVPTPSGYLYVDGYWDYPVARRGLSFAPVVFAPTVLTRPNYSYTPTVALAAGGLLANLFVRPNYHQYYFGDYYAGGGRGPGSRYVPWFGVQRDRLGYDPLYSQMSVLNARRQPDWDRRLQDDYRYRLEHQEARPAQTYFAERARLDQRRSRGEEVRDFEFVRPLNQWNQGGNPERRLVAVDQAQRAEIVRRQVDIKQFRETRLQQEVAARRPANARPEDNRPRQIPIARSPIVAGRGGRGPGGGNPVAAAPPSRPEQHNAFRPAFQQGPQGPRPNRPDGPQDGGPRPNRPDGPRDRPDGPRDGRPNRPDDDGLRNRPNPDRPRGDGPQGPGRGPDNPQARPQPAPQPQPQPAPQPIPQPQPVPQPGVGTPAPGGPRPGGEGRPRPKADGDRPKGDGGDRPKGGGGDRPKGDGGDRPKGGGGNRPKGEGGNRPNGQPGGGTRADGGPRPNPFPQPGVFAQQAGGPRPGAGGQPDGGPRRGRDGRQDGPRAGGNPPANITPQVNSSPQPAVGPRPAGDGRQGGPGRPGGNDDRPGPRNNRNVGEGAARMTQPGGARQANQPPQAGPRPIPTSNTRPRPQQPGPNAAAAAPQPGPRPEGKAAKKKKEDR